MTESQDEPGLDAPVSIFRFGDVEVDLPQLSIRRAGQEVRVQHQVFAVLTYLLEHRDRVVTKVEILDNVWGDRFVGESALTSRIKSIRQAVGDDGKTQAIIRTVHGQGYQFVAKVEDARQGTAPEATTDTGAIGPRLTRPGKTLIGRAALLESAAGVLAPGSATTFTGPAGVGKTHLARTLGANEADRFPDGSWFVSLADVRQQDAVADTVLQAMGEQRLSDGDAVDGVVAKLKEKHSLLILDNCEHLLSAVQDLVERVLQECQNVAILTTSRLRLGTGVERLVDVPPLDAPASVELFLSAAATSGVDISAASEQVSLLCDQLDHLPLALELAGAQVRALGLDGLVSLLDERLELLSDLDQGPGRSLVRAIASSFDRLDDDHQRTLAIFSQFAGSFDLRAASALAQSGSDLSAIDAVKHVIDLTEHSLLVVERTADETRYRLLESIRLFAEEQLEEREKAIAAHLAYYLSEAKAVQDGLLGNDFETAWAVAGNDWPNYRAALDYALESGRLSDAEELLAATIDYAELAQEFEHVSWSERTLAAWPSGEPVEPRLYANLGRLIAFQGRGKELGRLAKLAGAPQSGRSAAIVHWWSAIVTGNTDEQKRCTEILVDLTSGSGGIGEFQQVWFRQLLLQDLDNETDYSIERTQRLRAADGPVGQAYGLVIDTGSALRAGQHQLALDICARQIALSERSGAHAIGVIAMVNRSIVLSLHPDLTIALDHLLDNMVRHQKRALWTTATIDAGSAALVFANLGHLYDVGVIIAARTAAGLTGGIRAVESELRRVEAAAKDDVRFSEGLAVGNRMDQSELCTFVIAKLSAMT